jgi:hypothetical protein
MGIHGLSQGQVYLSAFRNNRTFGKMDLFPSSGEMERRNLLSWVRQKEAIKVTALCATL